MFKLSKKVEYGLMAIKYIASQGEFNPCSAKVISRKNKIPYDLLSKILQRLKKEKILYSVMAISLITIFYYFYIYIGIKEGFNLNVF